MPSKSINPTLDLFKGTNAFFTPLLPPSLKALYAHSLGRFISAEAIEKEGSNHVTYFFGLRSSLKECPLIERLRAVGVEITNYTYIQESIDSGRLLDKSSYLIEPKPKSLDLKTKRKSPPLYPIIHPSPPKYVPSNLSNCISYHSSSSSPPSPPPSPSSELEVEPQEFPEITESDIRGATEIEQEEGNGPFEEDFENDGVEVRSSFFESSKGESSSHSSTNSKSSPDWKYKSSLQNDSKSATSSLSPPHSPRKRKRTHSIALEVEEEAELIDEQSQTSFYSNDDPPVKIKEEVEDDSSLFIPYEITQSSSPIYFSLLQHSPATDPITIPISHFLETVSENLLLRNSHGNSVEMTEEARTKVLKEGLKEMKTNEGGFVGKRIKISHYKNEVEDRGSLMS